MAELNGAEHIRLVALAYDGTSKEKLAKFFDLQPEQVDAILAQVATQGLFVCCKRWYEADAGNRRKVRKGVPNVSLSKLPKFKRAAIHAVEHLHYQPYLVAKVFDLKYEVVYGWLHEHMLYN